MRGGAEIAQAMAQGGPVAVDPTGGDEPDVHATAAAERLTSTTSSMRRTPCPVRRPYSSVGDTDAMRGGDDDHGPTRQRR